MGFVVKCANFLTGRLTKDDIDRMVKEAEQYKNDDDKQRDRIQAKNGLESYAFNMKSTVEDEKLKVRNFPFLMFCFARLILCLTFKDKISESDRKIILDKCQDIIKWLDSNQLAEKEEFEHKLKEAEGVCNPIITKLYQVRKNCRFSNLCFWFLPVFGVFRALVVHPVDSQALLAAHQLVVHITLEAVLAVARPSKKSIKGIQRFYFRFVVY